MRLAGLVERQVWSDNAGVGKAPTGVPGGGSAAHEAASAVDTTRSGSAVFGSSDVARVNVHPASVPTQSAAAGKSESNTPPASLWVRKTVRWNGASSASECGSAGARTVVGIGSPALGRHGRERVAVQRPVGVDAVVIGRHDLVHRRVPLGAASLRSTEISTEAEKNSTSTSTTSEARPMSLPVSKW